MASRHEAIGPIGDLERRAHIKAALSKAKGVLANRSRLAAVARSRFQADEDELDDNGDDGGDNDRTAGGDSDDD